MIKNLNLLGQFDLLMYFSHSPPENSIPILKRILTIPLIGVDISICLATMSEQMLVFYGGRL